jgi:hypothetical protein
VQNTQASATNIETTHKADAILAVITDKNWPYYLHERHRCPSTGDEKNVKQITNNHT